MQDMGVENVDINIMVTGAQIVISAGPQHRKILVAVFGHSHFEGNEASPIFDAPDILSRIKRYP
jgi:hypothetical protein